MGPSGSNYPSTSERTRRGHDPTRIAREYRALSGHVEQEEESVVRSYEKRFLGLPSQIVLAAMWVAGMALVSSCALTLYFIGSSLLRILN